MVTRAPSRSADSRNARDKDTSALNSPGPVRTRCRPVFPSTPAGFANAAGFSRYLPPGPGVEMKAWARIQQIGALVNDHVRALKPDCCIAYTENGSPDRAAASPEMAQSRNVTFSHRGPGGGAGVQTA